MSETSRRFEGRVLAVLLVLNLVVHFVPFARPGFQPDDFTWLELARRGEPWSFVSLSLAHGVRPLGLMLFMMEPYVLGLHEGTQLLVLALATSALTLLVYAWLAGIFESRFAALAALAFVVWPVKHEIYASQLFAVNNLAAILVVASGLLFRRWTRGAGTLSLLAGVSVYGLSLFVYELGYLAPIVFYVAARRESARAKGAAWFLIPAVLYWVLRLSHPEGVIGTGRFEVSTGAFLTGLPSLPSNLVGFQVARNLGYGLFAVASGPWWFMGLCALTSAAVVVLGGGWIRGVTGSHVKEWAGIAGGGLLGAAALAAPAAMILVESRHSVLASAGMGITIAAIATRLPRVLGQALFVVLLLSSQGLALRQAEVSRLQASVYQNLAGRRDEIRAAGVVIIDMASLAERIPYTWGGKTRNVLRAYWGLHAFAAGGLQSMVSDVLYQSTPSPPPQVAACATNVVVTEEMVRCDRHYATGRSFSAARAGTLVIDFKALALPPSLPQFH